MKLSVEEFSSSTGFVAGAGVTMSVNQHPEYFADNLTASLQVAITAGNGITKDLSLTPINVTDYDELTFHIKSFNYNTPQMITTGSFYYTLDLGTGVLYHIPTNGGFNPVTIYIGDVTSITKIELLAVGSIADTIILSGMVASKDELPLDIFTSIRTELQNYLDTNVNFSMGVISSAASGDKSVTVTSPNWLEANCIVKITSGVNSEYHHVSDYQDGVLTFSTLYDGTGIIYDHTDATVTFFIPVNFGTDKEIILPGITLWEDNEEVSEARNKENVIYDTKTDTTFKVRKQVRYTKYSILVDIEAWQTEVMKVVKHYTRNWIERESLWINGKQFHSEGNEVVTTNITSRVEGIDIVPKTQYIFKIQIGVNLWERETLMKTSTINLTTEPEANG